MNEKVRKRVMKHISHFKYKLKEEQIEEIVTLYVLNNKNYDSDKVSLQVENFMKTLRNNKNSEYQRKTVRTVFAKSSDPDYVVPNYEKDEKTFDFLISKLVGNVPFCFMNNDQKVSLVKSMCPIEVKKDTILIHEGDEGEEMYIVESGEFSVTVKNRFKTVIKPGEVFGELALLHGIPRTATVTAIQDSKVWSATQAAFSAIRIKDSINRNKLIMEALENSDKYKEYFQRNKQDINNIVGSTRTILIKEKSTLKLSNNEIAVILKEGTINDGEERKVFPKNILNKTFCAKSDIECVLIRLRDYTIV